MSRPNRPTLAVAALVAVGALSGCAAGDAAPRPDAGRLQVVTTVAPITSIVADIVGDRARVVGVVPEGTNSHTFEPPPSVARTLAEADIVFLNGLQLEEPTKALAGENVDDGVAVVELGDRTIDPDQYAYDFSFPRSEGKPNPHLWTNPPMAIRYAEIVGAEMARLDPEGASHYATNVERFTGRALELDAAMRASFASVPAEKRKLLTYHDAYAYFAEEYDWEVIGAIQVSDFTDPTPKEVAGLIEQVRAAAVPAIFGSEVFPSPVLELIGREAGVRYVDDLRDDDLPGEPGEPAHSWLGLMRFDFVTLVEAMGGDAVPLRALDVASATTDRAVYPQ